MADRTYTTPHGQTTRDRIIELQLQEYLDEDSVQLEATLADLLTLFTRT